LQGNSPGQEWSQKHFFANTKRIQKNLKRRRKKKVSPFSTVFTVKHHPSTAVADNMNHMLTLHNLNRAYTALRMLTTAVVNLNANYNAHVSNAGSPHKLEALKTRGTWGRKPRPPLTR
jgi:hypothetical protein